MLQKVRPVVGPAALFPQRGGLRRRPGRDDQAIQFVGRPVGRLRQTLLPGRQDLCCLPKPGLSRMIPTFPTSPGAGLGTTGSTAEYSPFLQALRISATGADGPPAPFGSFNYPLTKNQHFQHGVGSQAISPVHSGTGYFTGRKQSFDIGLSPDIGFNSTHHVMCGRSDRY